MNETRQQEDKRRFSRVLFNAECTLHQNDMEWLTELQDISLKGILVRKPDHLAIRPNESCEATIRLAGSDSCILMSLDYSHEDEQSIGFKCKYIDIDSMTHLKRLVELNIGDNEMLKRELEALSSN
ncbi:MAG: PilZ domain-containing protein [Oleiphilus sp.]|nr:MAG: PilZ domain-containing protein [Oleiphilus sp.]